MYQGNQTKKINSGINCGPFTFRAPFVHAKVSWSELAQGICVTAASGLALVPLLQAAFGLEFSEAVTLIFLNTLLLGTAPLLFGDPYAPGWLTPAIPLVLAHVTSGYTDFDERFQVMTALSLEFAVLLFFMGITGLGQRFHNWLPRTLKACIIMGASLSALKRIFFDDVDTLHTLPATCIAAITICLLLTFSTPLKQYIVKSKVLAAIANLGLLPAFIAAMIVGLITNELSYNIQWGIFVPEFSALWQKVSPMHIGWPSMDIYISVIPLVLVSYIIFFGDVVTGEAVIKESQHKRPDDIIDFKISRTHFSCAIRNAVMGMFSPFFSTQGVLWTGVHVVIVKRWEQGEEKMKSLFGGLASYNIMGFSALLLLFLPLLTLLKPVLPVALLLTLMLTAYACAYIALDMIKTKEEKGAVILSGMALTMFDAWIGLAVSVLAVWLLVGKVSSDTENAPSKAK